MSRHGDWPSQHCVDGQSTDGKWVAEDVDLDDLAAVTAGYSGADLETLVRETSMRAIREVAAEATPEEADERTDDVTVRREHFDAALETVAAAE